ncbi:thrombopoietin receptor [Leptodactylus fuscus]
MILNILCSAVEPKVTEEDLILLSRDSEVPHCFCRRLETVICYWEAEELRTEDIEGGEDVSYGFYYVYDQDEEVECELSVQTGRRTLYVCEHDEVILFNDLTVFVRDKKTNRTLSSRTFELELIVIIDPPYNIHVEWEEDLERFLVTWSPPKMDINFSFKYEVQFWFVEEECQSLTIDHLNKALLPKLRPGFHYHMRIRTSWNMEKSSLWGPWSKTIPFYTIKSAETISMQCSTSDLLQVCCAWDNKVILDASVHYRYGKSIWRPCTHPSDCQCMFPARNNSTMTVKLNATSEDGKISLYYNKPFWINHVVLPPTPNLHIRQQSANKLALEWSSPIPDLGKHLMYQIRFSIDNEKSWTTLQVPPGVHSKVISTVYDKSYSLQIRASPSQEEILGSWSEWSARVTAKSASVAWVTPVIIMSVLLVLAAGLSLPCIFPSFYRKLKDKLWPPLPNLHRVLDTFLTEIQKHYQPDSTVYEKPLEEAVQPSCLEIVYELTPTNESQQVLRDYVQLAPPSYQNEEYWPDLEPLELNSNCSANNQLPRVLTNQTYVPSVWNQG